MMKYRGAHIDFFRYIEFKRRYNFTGEVPLTQVPIDINGDEATGARNLCWGYGTLAGHSKLKQLNTGRLLARVIITPCAGHMAVLCLYTAYVLGKIKHSVVMEGNMLHQLSPACLAAVAHRVHLDLWVLEAIVYVWRSSVA